MVRGFTNTDDEEIWGLAKYTNTWIQSDSERPLGPRSNDRRNTAGILLSKQYVVRNDINDELEIAINKEVIIAEHLTPRYLDVVRLARNKQKHHKTKSVGSIKKDVQMIDLLHLDIDLTKLINMNEEVKKLIIKEEVRYRRTQMINKMKI